MSSGKSGLGPVAVVGIGFIIAVVGPLGGGVWPVLVVIIVVALALAFGRVSWVLFHEYRTEINDRAQQKREERSAAARKELQQTARLREQRLIAELGTENAAVVESAKAAVKRVVASDAARAGWLGDVDFTADIAGITDNFRKAHELRKVAQQLSKLDQPSVDDQKILADARRAAADLVATAGSRVKLIQKCAEEADMVDQSLRQERKDAQTAEQRAELHAKLSSMLYGIDAASITSSANSAADSVMARVQAYREIKNQIQLARGD